MGSRSDERGFGFPRVFHEFLDPSRGILKFELLACDEVKHVKSGFTDVYANEYLCSHSDLLERGFPTIVHPCKTNSKVLAARVARQVLSYEQEAVRTRLETGSTTISLKDDLEDQGAL